MDSRGGKYKALFRASSVRHPIFAPAFPHLLTIADMIFCNTADRLFHCTVGGYAKVAAFSILMPVAERHDRRGACRLHI